MVSKLCLAKTVQMRNQLLGKTDFLYFLSLPLSSLSTPFPSPFPSLSLFSGSGDWLYGLLHARQVHITELHPQTTFCYFSQWALIKLFKVALNLLSSVLGLLRFQACATRSSLDGVSMTFLRYHMGAVWWRTLESEWVTCWLRSLSTNSLHWLGIKLTCSDYFKHPCMYAHY